ncbi:MAG: hypothetical protein NT166_24635 [Candidatus Aminicenantes bacterium]|nr:hypothetical protein [Candidatus Aminicenantes bacterium]
MAKNKKDDTIVLKAIQDGYGLADAYFNVKVGKALSVKNIVPVMGLEQLTGNRLENFYVDTDKVREANTISSLEKLLKDPLTPYTKRLFSGFAGSGKTTELIKLCFELQQDFNIIIFSAMAKRKLKEITLEFLLFEIVEDALNYLRVNNLVDETDELLAEIVNNIADWCFDTRIVKEIKKEKLKSRGAGIDLLKGIFFNAKSERRTSASDRIEASRIEEPKINDLIFECNKIFDYLKEKTGKETLIIIDDLEKMTFLAAREFYTGNSAFIRDFHCKMVLTIPVELIFHADFAIIQNIFGEAEVLPMIKIKDARGKVYQPGVDCLTKILEKRLDLSLFENQCWKEAVRYSGGAIRDLFSIIQRAGLNEESEIITESSMKKSVNLFKDTFASRVQERNDEIKIKFEEYLEVLFEIYDGNKTAPKRNLALLDLLRTRSVMKYNGEGFYDTHPLLDNFIKAYKEKDAKK